MDSDVIYLSINSWDSIRQRPQHLAAGLSKHGRVLYVDPVTPSVAGNLRKVLTCQNVRNWVARLTRVSDNLYRFTPPPMLPLVMEFGALNRANQAALAMFLRTIARSLGMCAPVLWIGLPLEVEQVGRLGESVVCYDCMDNHAGFWRPGSRRQRLVERLEHRMLTRADLVLASAESLARKCSRFNSNVHWVPNACEFEHFASTKEAALPSELTGLPRPLVGYIGTVSHWLDLNLVYKAAFTHPDWSFVIVGPVDIDVASCARLSNLRFLGRMPYASLPSYVRAFDACLIPFRINDLTGNVDPVKLYEYWAAGKPVVTTALPELQRFAGLCYISRHEAEFLSNLEVAVRERETPGSAEKQQARIAVAQTNTWEARSATVVALLREALQRKRR